MKYSNTVEYNINTKLDSSGLTKLQAQIKQLENSMQQMSNRELLNSDKVQKAKTQLEGLNTALTNSFNSSLGILDLTKFRAELDSRGVSAKSLQSAFNMMGAEGQAALNGLTTQIANFNGGMERTSSAVDKVFTTFSNTFRWGFISSFFSQFMNAIHSSIDYVKELDDSLTQIMLVTDYNRDSMNQFAKSANEAAKAVSMTTTGMTNASLIFAQQGYNLNQSQELATLSAKLANASQQDTATTSDQITAYMNAYGLENSIGELTQAMDNWALIANVSAADVGELAQASQRAASMANAVGVNGEQLASQIATIESVTREAPEQIGNGLKTLYARFSDIAAGGEDEDGFTLGKVTSQLQAIGVQVFDKMGQIRDVGDIMEDLMVIWDDLDQTSKVAASQALAGKYQVNRFMALMDNSDMYEQYKSATGNAATGTLDQMNQEYADSIEGRSAKLQASLEGLFSTIFNTDDIYPWMDAAQGAVDLLRQFFDALGGGKTVLLGITSLLAQAFNQNIARSINDITANYNLGKIRENNINSVGDTLDRVGIDRSQGIGKYIDSTAAQAKLGALSDTQYDTYMNNVQQWANAQTALTQAQEELTDTINVVNMVYGKATGNKNAIFNDEGILNTQLANDERAALSDRQLNRLMQDTDFSDVAEKAKEFSQSLQNVENQMKNVNADSENYDQQMTNLAQAIDLAGDKLAEFNALNVVSDDMVESILGDLTSLETKIRAGGEASEEAEKEIAELISMISRLGKSAKDMSPQAFKQAMLGAGDIVDKKKGNLDFAQTQVNRAEENALEDQKNIDNQQKIKGILDTMNAVQQLTFAWQAFQNLGSLWANEDLSIGEKILQTIMNLTMAMPQLIAAMDTLKTSDSLKNIGQNFLSSLDFSKDGQKSLFAKEQFDELVEFASAGRDAMKTLGNAGEDMSDKIRKGLEKTIAEGALAEDALTKIGPDLLKTSMVGATGLEAIKVSLAGLATSAKVFLAEFWPLLLIGAAVAGISALIGAAQEQAEQAHQEAMSAFEDAKNAQEQMENIKTSVKEYNEAYNSYKDTGEGVEELTNQANALADAMREAGQETEAEAIHLAAVRAEALGTASSVEELTNIINQSSWEAEGQTNRDVIRASGEVLETQGKSFEAVIRDQEKLKQRQEELNNLDPWDPNYKARKEELENLIQVLQNTIDKEQEAIDAANAAMNAQGEIAGMNALGLNGDNNGMQTTARGWEDGLGPADAIRTADAETLRSFFSQNVQGFDALSSVEQLDFMLQHVKDDAQKAAIEVQQLLEANNSLGSSRVEMAHRENGENIPTQTFNDYEDITAALTQTDMSAEQSLTLIASLDKDASRDKILGTIAEIKSEMESNGGNYELALQATLDEETLENVRDQVRNSISEMEPADSDIDKETLQETARYFQDMAGELDAVPDEIALSTEELNEFTEAVLRYDDALQDADEHLQDWKKTLKNSSAAIGDQAEAFEGLRDLLGDLLDLDTDNLSTQFMQSAEALDLLDKAIYGTGDEADMAYDQLNALANLDMAGMLNWEDGVWSLNDSFNSLKDIATDIGSSVEGEFGKVENAAVYAMDTIEGLMSGTISAPEVDATAFVDGLNQMVQSGQMSVDEALAAMDGAQVEADVVTETQEEPDTKQAIGWRAVPTEKIPISARVPVTPVGGTLASGAEIDYQDFAGSIQGWTYEPETQTETETKETTVSSVGYKANHNGNGSGNISFRNGRHKSNSGANKRSNSTGGSGSHSRPSSGGGGGGRSCFVAGTKISTCFGFKNIEDIQKGYVVLSYNIYTKRREFSTVVQTMIHNTTEPIYTLYIKDEQLKVTGIHRFLIKHNLFESPCWIAAQDLKVSDWVLFADNTWHLIWKIESQIETTTVYNFEVSGNHNYYVGCNQILAHNKGGGGGGGKKPKTIEPKEKKEHKKDYYEEVNSQLDKTEKILSRIEKEEDRLIGDKARANQNKQLSNLAKEIELQKEKQKIQQQELKDVDALMRKRTREAQRIAINSGVGAAIPTAVYDEDGVIANYEQMSAAIDNVHNKLIDKYNAAAKAGNEELAKEIQKTIEKFDKYGEDLLNNAQRHNELQSEIEETTNALEELEDAMEDIRIEAFKAHQEAIDDLKDLREGAAELASLFRDFDEDGFLTRWSLDDTPIGDMVEAMYELDNIYTVTQEDANAFYQDIINKKRQDLANTTDADERAAIQSAISYFQGQQANLSSTDTLQNGLLGLANQDLDMLRGWIEGTNSEPNPFGENEAALWEAYQEAYDRSIELFKDWRETVRDLRDSIIDAYDEQEEAIEQHIDEYDRLLDHLERMNDTYSLYYGEDSYDGILAIMDQQGSTMQQQLNSLTTAYNYWQEQYEAAVANGDEKLIQGIREKMEDAEDAMYDKAEELAEHWVERYETAVDASIQKVDFQLWGGGPGQMDFEDQTMIWELQKDYISTYKDDVERAYEVDKLRSKYINLLNDAQGMSLQIQNKIRGQMQEQLDLLQNQGTMSEYDVKLANAKLEILQKQIALEDAQRNKNKMQLRRDTQGNYRYVYTANQGDVQKAQDELNESQYDAYEMTKEQTIANNDRAVSLYQDYMEKLRNIANKYKDDEVARAAALKALNEEYSKLLGALEEDFKDTTNGMYDVLTWMVENGTQDTATAAMDMLDQLYDKNGEVKENTGNDWRDLATHITTDVLPNIEEAVQEGIADINAEAFDLQTNMVGDDGVLTKIGSSVDTLGTSLDSIVEKTDSWTQAVTELFNAFFADDRGIQDAMAQLEAMSQQLSENQTATSALSTRYNEANSALQASRAESQHYQTALDFATGARSVQAGSIIKLKKGTFVHYDRYGGYQQDEQGHTGWRLPKDMWVKFGRPISGVPLPYNFYATGESLKSFGDKKDPKSDQHGGVAKTDFRHHQQWWFDKKELQKNVLNAMDTGGYTGEWHDQTSLYKNGKVALLHQKELVLNAMDTENILAAVSLMRDMTKGSMMGLSSSIGGFGTASSSYNPITEQRVEIQASFPNATDAEDIRQALIGLSDRAYQYAHRTI